MMFRSLNATCDVSVMHIHSMFRLLKVRKLMITNYFALRFAMRIKSNFEWLIVGLLMLLPLLSMAQTNGVTDANAKLAREQIQMAQTAHHSGDEKSAMQKVDEALRLDPKSISAMLWKVDLHGRLKEYQQAVQWAKTALEIDPKNESALSNNCWNLVLLKNLEDAEQSCRRVLELSSFDYSANVNLGHIFLIRGREEQAYALYRSGLWHIENESDLRNGPILDFTVLRDIYGRLSVFDPAEQWFKLHGPRWVVRDAPANASAEHFAQAVDKQPEKVSHWVNLCWYQLLAGNTDAAGACASARELESMDVSAQLTTAYVAWFAGDQDAARRWLKRAAMLSKSHQELQARFDIDITVLRLNLSASNADLLVLWMKSAIDEYLQKRTSAQNMLLESAIQQTKDLKERGFRKPGSKHEREFQHGALARYFRAIGAQFEVEALLDLLMKTSNDKSKKETPAIVKKRDAFTCPASLSLEEADKTWRDLDVTPDAPEWQQIGECMKIHLLPAYSFKVPVVIQESYPDLIALSLTCKTCDFLNLTLEKVKQIRRQVLRGQAANLVLLNGTIDLLDELSDESERYLDNRRGWLSPNELRAQLDLAPNIRSHTKMYLQAAHDVHRGAYRDALIKLQSAINMLDFGPDRFSDSVDADEALFRFTYHLAVAFTAAASGDIDSASIHLRAGSLSQLSELRKALPRHKSKTPRAAASASDALVEIGNSGWFVVKGHPMQMAEEFIGSTQIHVMESKSIAEAWNLRVEAARRFIKSSNESLEWVAESESQVSDALDRTQLAQLSPTLVVNHGCDGPRSAKVKVLDDAVTVCSVGGVTLRRFNVASDSSELLVTGNFLVESGRDDAIASGDYGMISRRTVLGTNWFDLRTGFRNVKDIQADFSTTSLALAGVMSKVERFRRPSDAKITKYQSLMVDSVLTRLTADNLIYQEFVNDYRTGQRRLSDVCGAGKPTPKGIFASGRIVHCDSSFAIFDAGSMDFVHMPYDSASLDALQQTQAMRIARDTLWTIDNKASHVTALDRSSGRIRAVMSVGRKLGKGSMAVMAGSYLSIADEYSVMLFNAEGHSLKPFYHYSGNPLGVVVDEALGLAAAWFTGGGGFVWSIADGSLQWVMNGAGPMKFDGELLLSVSKGTLRTFKARTGEGIFSIGINAFDVHTLLGTMNRLMLISDNSLEVWAIDTAGRTSKRIFTYNSFDGGEWVVSDPEGRFDTGDLESMPHLHWVMPDDPFTPVPLEAFMKDYYEPRLLARILAGEKFKAVRPLTSLNRTQPEVQITSVKPDSSDTSLVTVTVSAAGATKSYLQGEKEVPRPTAVHDLRLFRDGQVVAYADGKLADNKGSAFSKTFTVRLPAAKAGKDVVFSAYAFNDDRVKSETVRSTYKAPSSIAALKGKAYVISMGVNSHDNPAWNLNFAANDARLVSRTVSEKLAKSTQHQEVVAITLISDGVNKQASKAAMKAILDRMSGKPLDAAATALLQTIKGADKLQIATPDDLVLLSFSGHGFADDSGNFYLIPQDTGSGTGKNVTAALRQHSISSEELSQWLRDVDAGDMSMIVDACQSAASVQGNDFKPGPMGSRGLGQLAFDKGMRILAASQSDEEALEDGRIQQGLLSYALVRDGLDKQKADYKPADRKITLDEWLNYGVSRVPSLADDVKAGKLTAVKGAIPVSADGKQKKASNQQPALFDFAKGRKEVVLDVGLK